MRQGFTPEDIQRIFGGNGKYILFAILVIVIIMMIIRWHCTDLLCWHEIN